MQVRALREQVGSGSYRVDPQAVADAILRRLLAVPPGAGPACTPPQGECS